MYCIGCRNCIYASFSKSSRFSQVQTKVANINKFESITYNKIDFEVIDYDKAPKTLTNGIDDCKSSEVFLYYLDSNTDYLYVATMNLDTNNHSVFLLNYHLVLVIKYRRKVIDDKISNRLKEIFEHICPKYNITLGEWNHDLDHVHLLFRGSPNTDISKFLNAYKSASSRLIKKEFPQIKKQLWKGYFWSRSYCLITTGGSPIDVVRKYIENQGMK